MIVVSNTSPLNYLILIEASGLLAALYGQVHVPVAVLQELGHSGSPAAVRGWTANLPVWLVVKAPTRADAILGLHAGEVHAIALAQELSAGALLMDERRGREAAAARGLQPIGTLGVLYEAAGRELIDLRSAVTRLTSETSFHWDKRLVDDVLRRHDARRASGN